ncbi:sensor domain-containing protein [Billgrantia endophytica]|uniref:GGDEF domain-containing protein n=1 Tax=Billgrantia endophytica TaxID=2033802 RepID=A0A2N7UBD1_9GAMM|nr:diguanylate cyclase [Halomonas endophytica]PMR77701.1 hypothetical protein C1H69_01600 [Halomonas endophytica]
MKQVPGEPREDSSTRPASEQKACPLYRRQQEELRLMAAAFETGQATLITDTDTRIIRVNQAFTRITGYRLEDVLGQTPHLFKSGRHGPGFYAMLWNRLMAKGHWQGEIWNRNKHGQVYPIWQSITVVKGDDDQVLHYVAVFHDITERKRIERALAREASSDHLTGVANRRSFDRALVKAVKSAQAEERELVLVLFDIDHFKRVNDIHGHDVGDEILLLLARCVQDRLRKTDLLARWGGEEFTLLLSDTPLSGALQLAERLRRDVARAIFPGPTVTISIGLTRFQPGDSARDLLTRADRALYRAKQNGRNRVEVMTPDASELPPFLERRAFGTSAKGIIKLPATSSAGRRPAKDSHQGSAGATVLDSEHAVLPSHSRLSRVLDNALAIAIERRGSLTLCALDIDHFKAINDTLGNEQADRLLVLLAERLGHYLQNDDMVMRTGGDEFVLLMQRMADDTALQALLEVISRPFTLGDRQVRVTASMGVSCFPNDQAEGDSLLRHAQQAMYRAKQNGRNILSRFDPRHDRQVQQFMVERRRFERAIDQDELRLHYQPQVDMATGQVVGVEALVRWQRPGEGLLAPHTFLPLIEGSRLEEALGEWVLRTALTQLDRWQELGITLPASVNISPSHLLTRDFVTRLSALLAEHPNVSPSRLKIEVVETAAMHDIQAALEVITRCQDMGVQMAIDDFGTGFSSLTYLRQLPVDLIKVDKSFVRDMLADPSDLAIVESVIYMSRRFGRSLLAEGVETLEHASELLARGCHLAQGYGIARPMPPESLEEWLAQWPNRADWQALAGEVGRSGHA